MVAVSGAVLEVRRVTPDALETASFSRRAAVNRTDSVLVDSGSLADCWRPHRFPSSRVAAAGSTID